MPLNEPTGITYGNGKFVCVNDNTPTNVYTSSDGQSWSQITTVGHRLKKVTYALGKFVAVGETFSLTGVICTSIDAQVWDCQNTGPDPLIDIDFGYMYNGL